MNKAFDFFLTLLLGILIGALLVTLNRAASVITEPDSTSWWMVGDSLPPNYWGEIPVPDTVYITLIGDSIKWVCTRMIDQEDYTCTLRMIP